MDGHEVNDTLLEALAASRQGANQSKAAKINFLVEKVEQLGTFLQSEEAQRVAWQEKCERLQDTVQKLQSANDVLQGRLERGQPGEATRRLGEALEQITALQGANARKTAEVDSLKADLDRLRCENNSLVEKLEAAHREMGQAAHEHEASLLEMSVAYQDQCISREATEDVLREKLDELLACRQSIEHLRTLQDNETTASQLASEESEALIQRLSDTIRTRESDIRKQTKEVQAALRRATKAEQERNDLREQLKAAQALTTKQEHRLKAVRGAKQNLEAQIQKYARVLDKQDQHTSALLADSMVDKEEAGQLMKLLQERMQQMEAVASRMPAQVQARHAAEEQLKQVLDKAEELAARTTESEQRAYHAESECSALRDELQATVEQFAVMEQQLEVAAAEISRLRRELVDGGRFSADLRADNAQLQGRLQSALQDSQQLRESLTRASSEAADDMRAARSSDARARQALLQSEQSDQQTSTVIASLRSEIRRLESELNTHRTALNIDVSSVKKAITARQAALPSQAADLARPGSVVRSSSGAASARPTPQLAVTSSTAPFTQSQGLTTPRARVDPPLRCSDLRFTSSALPAANRSAYRADDHRRLALAKPAPSFEDPEPDGPAPPMEPEPQPPRSSRDWRRSTSLHTSMGASAPAPCGYSPPQARSWRGASTTEAPGGSGGSSDLAAEETPLASSALPAMLDGSLSQQLSVGVSRPRRPPAPSSDGEVPPLGAAETHTSRPVAADVAWGRSQQQQRSLVAEGASGSTSDPRRAELMPSRGGSVSESRVMPNALPSPAPSQSESPEPENRGGLMRAAEPTNNSTTSSPHTWGSPGQRNDISREDGLAQNNMDGGVSPDLHAEPDGGVHLQDFRHDRHSPGTERDDSEPSHHRQQANTNHSDDSHESDSDDQHHHGHRHHRQQQQQQQQQQADDGSNLHPIQSIAAASTEAGLASSSAPDARDLADDVELAASVLARFQAQMQTRGGGSDEESVDELHSHGNMAAGDDSVLDSDPLLGDASTDAGVHPTAGREIVTETVIQGDSVHHGDDLDAVRGDDESSSDLQSANGGDAGRHLDGSVTEADEQSNGNQAAR